MEASAVTNALPAKSTTAWLLTGLFLVGGIILYIAAFQKVRDSLTSPTLLALASNLVWPLAEVLLASLFVFSRHPSRLLVLGFAVLWGAFAVYHALAVYGGSLTCPCFGSLKVQHKSMLWFSGALSALDLVLGGLSFRKLPPLPVVQFRQLVSFAFLALALVIVPVAIAKALPTYRSTDFPISFQVLPGAKDHEAVQGWVEVPVRISNLTNGNLQIAGAQSSCGLDFLKNVTHNIPHGKSKEIMVACHASTISVGKSYKVRLYYDVSGHGLQASEAMLFISVPEYVAKPPKANVSNEQSVE